MKRHTLGVFFKGVGMGAADAVPGVSGGTIAFVTGIYERLIHCIRQFGPGAWNVWRQHGFRGLHEHLDLAFLLPLLLGVAVSLFSVAHLAIWLMESQPLLLDGFFFGLVAASALVVHNAMKSWRFWYLLPLVFGLLLANALPGLMPMVLQLGNQNLLVVVAGAIAISAMLLPGVSGSFLLLTMGLYGTIMQAIRSLDLAVIGLFGIGCLLGLALFSRLLTWLFQRQHDATMQLLLGFIVGSLPILWPWRELTGYQLGPEGQMIPLAFRHLMPGDYAQLVGGSAQLGSVLLLMLVGAFLVIGLNHQALKPQHSLSSNESGANKE